MGLVYADIKLINADDVAMVKRHFIGEEEIREITINMMVDSGAYEMAINERIQDQMGFSFIEKRRALLADGRVGEFDFVGPVMVKFANRTAICSAMVLPGDCDPLLGAIPMEEMDVMIHPRRQELIVNPAHPEGAVLSMRGFQIG
jgi:clan AA aspartic protease